MANSEDLRSVRRYLQEVQECVGALRIQPDSAELAHSLTGEAADLVRTIDDPLRIGLVGEFSTGKSLLLGVLVGKPDLLPTSSNPTTGNITELRFSRTAGETAVKSIDVHYFSAAEVTELDGLIIGELRAQGAAPSEVDEMIAVGSTDLAAIRGWCEKAMQNHDAGLRKLIREWWFTRQAVTLAPEWLGQRRQVAEAGLRDVLEIGYPPLDQGLPPAATGPARWADRADPDLTGLTFPLVERVVIEVEVSSQVWDFAEMTAGDEFVLIDFPGIGGGLTRARDLFLTRRGLTDVHTVLVLVNAERPGGEAPEKFFTFLRDLDSDAGELGSKIIYAAGRFDQLIPPDVLSGAAGRLTEAAVTDASTPLRALLQSGHRPGPASMAAFVSSVLAISRAGMLGAPEELGLAYHEPAARDKAEQWQRIADRLIADGTGQNLARALRAYTADGGVGNLRAMLEEHVRSHGLELRLQRLRGQVDQLEQQKSQLVADLREHEQAESQQASPLARARRFLAELDNHRDRLIFRQLPALRDPAQVPVGPDRSLRDDVVRKATELVVAWPEWGLIFNRVQDGVVVPPVVTATGGSALARRRQAGPPPTPLPQTVGDFLPRFITTCDQLRTYARASALDGTGRWLADRGTESGELRREAAAALDGEARNRLAAGPLADFPGLVDDLLSPDGIMAAVVEDVATELRQRAAPAAAELAAKAFPFRPEQATSWSDGGQYSQSTRHLVRVLRIRSALIDSATRFALDDLDTFQGSVHGVIDGFYRSDASKLPTGTQRADLLAAMAGLATGSPEHLPSGADALAAIGRPEVASWPAPSSGPEF